MKSGSERRSIPRAHIYIAGSFFHLASRNEDAAYFWKVGKAYNIIDRFWLAPNSYCMEHRGHGYYPKYVWHWVENATATESRILNSLSDNIDQRYSKNLPYSSEVVSNVNVEIIKNKIIEITKTEPTFHWDDEDYTADLSKFLKSVAHNDKKQASKWDDRSILNAFIKMMGHDFSL
ncbi:hypothetical protein [Acetobacter indonesiensis]|uniref:Uncharacterized protein n=2 Tax=Acetobacter indonesiensis TaxID=104101 RepID=A0A6N3T7C2_9PROT|nr:hypothetical protein [Acetobacter indonesiensis]GAN63231.1 hypothetical protein Abin_024_016 [Acetobacter indonesiensis]GEN03940.1 hypothetical protein AIN02nite_19650 [Acetobacter indonesiensis]